VAGGVNEIEKEDYTYTVMRLCKNTPGGLCRQFSISFVLSMLGFQHRDQDFKFKQECKDFQYNCSSCAPTELSYRRVNCEAADQMTRGTTDQLSKRKDWSTAKGDGLACCLEGLSRCPRRRTSKRKSSPTALKEQVL